MKRLVILAGSIFLAATSAIAKEDVQKLAERMQESKQKIVEAESEKRRILGSLYTINKRMKKITSEKSHLTDELIHVQDTAKSIAKVIAELETAIDKQKIQLRRRLRAVYKLSGDSYIAILFSSTTMQDLDETLRFMKIVTESDYRLIRSYQMNVAAYKLQKEKLKSQVERLVAIERKIKSQENLLAKDHKTKTKIVSELDRQRTINISRIKTLRSRTSAIDDVSSLLKPSIFEKKGQLPAPVQGEIVQDFGLINHRHKIRLSHKGWRYSAPAGSPVANIFEGTVVFSNWIQGYGQTVIVDHGDHYYTVYAHIARVKVKTGDTLKTSEVFAEAGPATRRHGEGLYFELRHFSEPENPAQWIGSKYIQMSKIEEANEPELTAELNAELNSGLKPELNTELNATDEAAELNRATY